jgi:hypothetical protein
LSEAQLRKPLTTIIVSANSTRNRRSFDIVVAGFYANESFDAPNNTLPNRMEKCRQAPLSRARNLL